MQRVENFMELHRRTAELYKATVQGKSDQVIELYEDQIVAESCPLTPIHDTVLHLATTSGKEKLVTDLLDLAPSELLWMRNDLGNTLLHEAAINNMVKAAEKILRMEEESGLEEEESEIQKRKEKLVEMRNEQGETPLFRAALFGCKEMFDCLESKINHSEIPFHLRRRDGATVLHVAILGQFYGESESEAELSDNTLLALQYLESADRRKNDLARLLLKKYPDLAEARDELGLTGLHLLANTPSAFESGSQLGLIKRFIYNCVVPNLDLAVGVGKEAQSGNTNPGAKNGWHIGWRRVWDQKRQHLSALSLARDLVERDKMSWRSTNEGGRPELERIHINGASLKRRDEKERKHFYMKSRKKRRTEVDIPLFAATRSGIGEIVLEIVNKYPQAVEYVDGVGHNILHVAVEHRQLKIFEFVTKMNLPMARLSRRIDDEGNSLLHRAAFCGIYTTGQLRPGPALQFQAELEWYKRVKKIMPPSFIVHCNEEGKTARDLFTEQHEPLHDQANKWLNKTADSCAIVAVLIATVAFAAAYTIPGGPNQKTGIPLFINYSFFMVFTVMDVLSLATSLSAVVMFLSILTSTFEEEEFYHSLPRKLTLGFTFLFVSIATLMLAFSTTIILTVRLNQRWLALMLYTVSFLPVTVFAVLQLPLYIALATTLKKSVTFVTRKLTPYGDLQTTPID